MVARRLQIKRSDPQKAGDSWGAPARFSKPSWQGSFAAFYVPIQHRGPFPHRLPDAENSRKLVEKGAEWVLGKVEVKQSKNTSNETVVLAVSAVFLGVFRLFSMSGIRHLSPWPQRLQPLKREQENTRQGKLNHSERATGAEKASLIESVLQKVVVESPLRSLPSCSLLSKF